MNPAVTNSSESEMFSISPVISIFALFFVSVASIFCGCLIARVRFSYTLSFVFENSSPVLEVVGAVKSCVDCSGKLLNTTIAIAAMSTPVMTIF